jgi:predicted DNA-binding transcriptional regulator AlpA
MLHADLSFFENLPDSALIREKLIIGTANNSGGDEQAKSLRIVPVSRSTWRRMVKAGQAPTPIKLHTGIIAWRVGDLREWLRKRSMS